LSQLGVKGWYWKGVMHLDFPQPYFCLFFSCFYCISDNLIFVFLLLGGKVWRQRGAVVGRGTGTCGVSSRGNLLLAFHLLHSESSEVGSGVSQVSHLELGLGGGPASSFQWRQPSLDVDVGDPNPDVVSFRSTWTKYIQENKQKWKERAASGRCHGGGEMTLVGAANGAVASPFSSLALGQLLDS
jgi:hypothetical protein